MVAALILVVALAALVHFAIIYSRSILIGIAAQELSESIREAAQIPDAGPAADDFLRVAALLDTCPDLGPGGSGIGLVKAYFYGVSAVQRLFPALSDWTAREMALCARYVAVLVDQRLQQTLAHAQQLRS